MGEALTETDLVGMLRSRYAAPSFAFLPGVRNSTGFARTVRTADGLAMGLWPSRGLHLHGFEIKVNRNDWLRELKDPEKADEIAKRCDFWWIVTPTDVIEAGELPHGWGHLVVRGSKLVAAKEPVLAESQPMTRPFLAAILRRATEGVVPTDHVDAEVQKRVKDKLERDRLNVSSQVSSLTWELQTLKKTIADFQHAAGVELRAWDLGNIAEAVKLVRTNDGGAYRERLERVARDAERIAQDIRARLVGEEVAR